MKIPNHAFKIYTSTLKSEFIGQNILGNLEISYSKRIKQTCLIQDKT